MNKSDARFIVGVLQIGLCVYAIGKVLFSGGAANQWGIAVILLMLMLNVAKNR